MDTVGVVDIAGQREREGSYRKAVVFGIKGKVGLRADVAAGPETAAVVTLGKDITNRAGVVDGLLGLAPKGGHGVVALILPVFVVQVIEHRRILRASGNGGLLVQIGYLLTFGKG